ncbi:hypothetical protein CSH63_25740 [Micromonospora tulbaghiae]|uniref:Uncharacterized protein n=1 Tax=Micromonospora tulbaghiae TaxID=479978 RepID=A0A386WS74_9ACTN|nr:hypothetical protein CSH63_25740 [Micromonospora tulbaghiae]
MGGAPFTFVAPGGIVRGPPVTFLIVPSRGPSVARPGMTSCPCRTDDPGGVLSPGRVASVDR